MDREKFCHGMTPGCHGTLIDKPIFLTGPGRSGTTLLLSLMSLHPDLAWFSGWTNRFPQWPQLAVLSRLNDLRVLEEATRELGKWPRPAEAYGIWDYCFAGFSRAESDWNEEAVHEAGAVKLKRLIESHLKWQGKPRFYTKYTGWPRFRFLKAICPDARFVYIDRDPRAVVLSYLKQKWWFKDKPQLLESMTVQERLDFYAQRYLAYYGVKRQFDANKDYIQIYYEQLIEDPSATLREICEKTALPQRKAFEQRIGTWSMRREANQAWRKALPVEDQTYLSNLLKQPLEEMGYEVS